MFVLIEILNYKRKYFQLAHMPYDYINHLFE